MIDIKLKVIKDGAVIPYYATEGSAGADISAYIKNSVNSVMLQQGARVLFETGIAIEIPHGYVGYVFPRSSLALHKGVTLANSVGVIDSDYRGELKVPLINHGNLAVKIAHGDRIAQLIVMPIETHCNFTVVEELSDTARGVGGFGSTNT